MTTAVFLTCLLYTSPDLSLYFLPRCGFGFFSKSDFCAILFSHFLSVSYTHLDVYKRQTVERVFDALHLSFCLLDRPDIHWTEEEI